MAELTTAGAAEPTHPLKAEIRGLVARPSGDGAIRIFLRLSAVTSFTVFTLTYPDRVVIDLPSLRWMGQRPGQGDIPGIIRTRFGAFSADRSRLILELEQPQRVERAFSEPARGAEPALLILDLVPTTREKFDAAAGAPPGAIWKGPRPAPPPQQAGALVIAIDPGHGGIDPGASSGGLEEKAVVLAIARELAARLEATDNFTPYLTRTADEFVPLDERVRRAHSAGAHAFLSLHADSVETGSANGVSLYTLSAAGTDQAAENFAARENRADLMAGADLSGEADDVARLLIELSQRGTGSESRKLADSLFNALGDRVTLLGSRPVREANFRVLKAPDMPSVLLELGFLDDPTDRARLTDASWRKSFANAVLVGLEEWRRRASPGFVQKKIGSQP